MGDPVLAGGALDRVHRPRPAWGPFFMVAALLLAGALLRFFWSVPVSAQGVYPVSYTHLPIMPRV